MPRVTVWRPVIFGGPGSEETIAATFRSWFETGKVSRVNQNDIFCCLPLLVVLRPEHVRVAESALHLPVGDLSALPVDRIQSMLKAAGKPEIKSRVCVDFSFGGWNDRLVDCPFTYQSIHTAVSKAARMVDPWFTKIDFAAYFLQIPLAEEVREMFGVNVGGAYYRFNAMPFGVKLGPAVASLVTSEIVKLAQAEFNVVAVSYIDDVLLISDGEATAKDHKKKFLWLLDKLGFVVNPAKVAGPSRRIAFLGIDLESRMRPGQSPEIILAVDPAKAESLEKAIHPWAYDRQSVTKELRSVLG
ncbi:reverse transcriptase domain-containing protein, partial [Bosea sp. (in: a-proteobacteria)]|uniref:reverse transcriptase domain-containing protein n=1 Tax=Bosea sp. (in: a-proteobacteria) TaxID=1871050 RepID=UPI001228119A